MVTVAITAATVGRAIPAAATLRSCHRLSAIHPQNIDIGINNHLGIYRWLRWGRHG
jgi:hypothetical protein